MAALSSRACEGSRRFRRLAFRGVHPARARRLQGRVVIRSCQGSACSDDACSCDVPSSRSTPLLAMAASSSSLRGISPVQTALVRSTSAQPRYAVLSGSVVVPACEGSRLFKRRSLFAASVQAGSPLLTGPHRHPEPARDLPVRTTPVRATSRAAAARPPRPHCHPEPARDLACSNDALRSCDVRPAAARLSRPTPRCTPQPWCWRSGRRSCRRR